MAAARATARERTDAVAARDALAAGLERSQVEVAYARARRLLERAAPLRD